MPATYEFADILLDLLVITENRVLRLVALIHQPVMEGQEVRDGKITESVKLAEIVNGAYDHHLVISCSLPDVLLSDAALHVLDETESLVVSIVSFCSLVKNLLHRLLLIVLVEVLRSDLLTGGTHGLEDGSYSRTLS